MNNFSILKARDSLRRGGTTSPNDSIVDVTYILKPLPKYDLKVGTDLNYSEVLNFEFLLLILRREIFWRSGKPYHKSFRNFRTYRKPKNIDNRIWAYEISAQASLNFPRLLLPSLL
jgi:hypothetical protein